MCGAWHFQRRNSSAERARSSKSLGRSLFTACISHETRRGETHELIARCAEFLVEAGVSEVQDSSKLAAKRQYEIGVAGHASELSIRSGEERLHFEHGGHLAVCTVEDREGIRGVIPSPEANRTDRRERRLAPALGDHPVNEPSKGLDWGTLECAKEFVGGVQANAS